jgi:DNA-binding transcriptional MocR family regulator
VLTRPGETVLTEQLTYPGIKALASLLHLNLHGLAMDEEGLRPDAFAAACRSVKAKVLYCIPTLQNPTASVMPEARRRELAAIAAANDVTIIEDDIYGALLPSAPRPIAVHAPAHCYYITGTSKSIAPGLRIGYLVVPLEAVERAANVIRTNLWETAPLMAEIMTTWIEDGTADRIIEWKRTETAARQRLALDVLGNLYGETRPITGSHLWLQLPEPWRSGDFIAQARSRGVIVTGSEAFVAGRATAPHAVRVCLGSPASRPQLAKGLKILAETLRNSPQPALTLT